MIPEMEPLDDHRDEATVMAEIEPPQADKPATEGHDLDRQELTPLEYPQIHLEKDKQTKRLA